MFRKRYMFYLLIGLISILLAGCSLPGLTGPPSNTIKIGTLGSSEQRVMGEIESQMINYYTDLNVETVDNLGSSTVQHQALTHNEIDISSARYTGTDITGALGMDPVRDPDEAMKIVKEAFEDKFDQTWFDSFGFANSYAFNVTRDLAEQEDLEKTSDLEPLASDLRIGAPQTWVYTPGTGYEDFKERYGFKFGNLSNMNIGLAYKAVEAGKMDVVLAYTTDGRLVDYDMKTLEDDEQLFPPFDASPLARNDTLEQHPKLSDILEKLAGEISTEKMQELSYEADVKLKDPAAIANDFLEENDYFEDK